MIGSWSCIVLLIGAVLSSTITHSEPNKSDARDYCEGEVFKAGCSYDEVIMIDRAVYGRMKLDRCVKVDMGYLGCQADVLAIADEKCSGRRSCDITIPDADFETLRPCLELKSYLLASYKCIKVLTVDTNECRNGKFLRPHHDPAAGRIASVTALETWCGNRDKPWLIEVPHGQRINLTLIDFMGTSRAVQSPSGESSSGPQSSRALDEPLSPCVKYATVVEKTENDVEERLVVCGRQDKQRHIYTSKRNVIQIQLEAHKNSSDHFIINYQAIGCPDPVVSNAVWFRRIDGDLLIGCRHSTDRWLLSCQNNKQWIGENLINCSSLHVSSSEVVHIPATDNSPPNVVLVAVLCVMVVLLLLLLFIVLTFIYKRHKKRSASTLADDPIVVKSTKTEASVTYVEDPESNYTASLHKNPRYGRHDQHRYHHHHHHHRHHVYDHPTPIESSGCIDRNSTYERVETSQTIGQFVHIWNTPLPKIPSQ